MTVEQDKRRKNRARTILAAQAVLGKGLPSVPCQVRDISETGARLTVEGTIALPDNFNLSVPKKGLSKPAEVRWRHGSAIGIEFLEDRQAAAARDPAVRVKELEAENADLRRRIAEMAERLFSYGDSAGKDDFY